MKKRALVLTVVAVLVLAGALYLWGPSSVPSGQAPLLTLSDVNFGDFESALGADTDAPRLLLLLSPT